MALHHITRVLAREAGGLGRSQLVVPSGGAAGNPGKADDRARLADPRVISRGGRVEWEVWGLLR